MNRHGVAQPSTAASSGGVSPHEGSRRGTLRELAGEDARATTHDLTVAVELTDYSVYYSQGLADAIAADLKEGKSEVVCEQGKLIKLSKDKEGVITRDVLTMSPVESKSPASGRIKITHPGGQLCRLF